MPEKRIFNLPMLRVEQSLWDSLNHSAAADDRSLSDYAARICRACARRIRFLVNCVRLGPANAAWVLDYEKHEDRP